MGPERSGIGELESDQLEEGKHGNQMETDNEQATLDSNAGKLKPKINPFVLSWFVDTIGFEKGEGILRESRVQKFERNPIVKAMRFNKKEKRLEQGVCPYQQIIDDAHKVIADLKAGVKK